MKNFINEFKSFAMKGNVIDLAVGIIIGSAFGKIVSSLVSDIIMPPIGFVLGGYDFKNYKLSLPSVLGRETVDIKYGLFLNNMIDFIIIAISVFLLIKIINRLKRQEQAKPKSTAEVLLLTEIRDLLKQK
jgi:large conductance mechanosensitive channel